MKQLYITIIGLSIAIAAFAQSPQKMSYQAVIRNSSNQLVTSHAVGIKISILQGSTTGTVVYTETQTPNTNGNGLVTIEFGGGTGFNTINWENGPYFVKTETDPTGGTNYTIVGTSQLLSVPYALHAKTAESANYNDLTNLPSLSISNWNTAYSWGNHAGLYRPIGYVPAWSEISNTPFAIATPADNQLLKYNATSSKWENWTPSFLSSFTETDPIYNASFDFTNALTSDLLHYNGTKWVPFTPNFALATHTHLDASTAASGFMSGADKTKLDGLQNADGTETKINAGTNVTVTGQGTIADPYVVNSAGSSSILPGTTTGDILYWNGTVWQLLHPGTSGQVLKINESGVPTWQNSTTPSLMPPTIVNISNSGLLSHSVTINVTANANGFFSHGEIELGLTTDYEFRITSDYEFEFGGNENVSKSLVVNSYTYEGDAYPLQPETTYHYRIWIENAVNTIYSEDMTFTTPPAPKDADGNTYGEVIIGNQIWTLYNLRTTKYNNGDPIPNVTANSDWISLTSGAWCQYNNGVGIDPVGLGNLYNFYAVTDPRGLCPTGWHVPTYDDWEELITFLGGQSVAGGKLKFPWRIGEGSSTDGWNWYYPNTGANNSSYFQGLPGGYRGAGSGNFFYLGYNAFFWTSSLIATDSPLYKSLNYDNAEVGYYYVNGNMRTGINIRCIKDDTKSKTNITTDNKSYNPIEVIPQ